MSTLDEMRNRAAAGEFIETREEVETTDYWCPTARDWSSCPGPCPDGTEHGPPRVRHQDAIVFRPVVGVSEETIREP
jgi:hypothetical protein